MRPLDPKELCDDMNWSRFFEDSSQSPQLAVNPAHVVYKAMRTRPLRGRAMARGMSLVLGVAVWLAWRPGLAADTTGPGDPIGWASQDLLLVGGVAIVAAVVAVGALVVLKLRRTHLLYRAIFGAVQQPRQVIDRKDRKSVV